MRWPPAVIHSDITLILILSLLIWSSPFVARSLHMPIPPVEIILGSIFAYFGFIGHNEYFTLIAEVGFLYLLFLAGMEVDLKQIINTPKEVIQKSILFLGLMVVFSIGSGLIFGLNTIFRKSIRGVLTKLVKIPLGVSSPGMPSRLTNIAASSEEPMSSCN